MLRVISSTFSSRPLEPSRDGIGARSMMECVALRKDLSQPQKVHTSVQSENKVHITELQKNGNGEWRFVCSCGYISTPATKEETLTELSRHDMED